MTFPENGLPWYQLTDSGLEKRADETTFTNDDIKSNYNIRVGGLVRIGGIICEIKAVDRTAGTVTLDTSVATTYLTAEFAYALNIDNKTVETAKTYGAKTGNATEIANDDGDLVVESVDVSTSTYTWEVDINSNNIPDGPITICYVAYDKSGNTSYGSSVTSVQNNRPALSKVTLGTDLSGNNSIETSEQITYSTLDLEGNAQSEVAKDVSSTFTAKALSSVTPEFVGGNGDIYYYLTSVNELSALKKDKVLVYTSGTKTYTPAELSVADLTKADDKAATLNYKFWDSTEELEVGSGTQWATLALTIKVDVVDGVAPTATIDPFHWTSAENNSLYNNSSKNGHIELEDDLPSATFDSTKTGIYDIDPKVSGKITITGSVYDDVRLGGINMSVTGLALNGGTAGTLTSLATCDKGTWTVSNGDITAKAGWAFKVTDGGITQDGHSATWQLDIDTSKVENVAEKDIIVSVQALDASTNASSDSSTGVVYATDAQYTAGTFYSTAALSSAGADKTNDKTISNKNLLTKAAAAVSGYAGVFAYTFTNTTADNASPYYRMDVVPYITGVTRSTSYNTHRTGFGYYPVMREEINNTITGFNLVKSPTVKVTPKSDGSDDAIEMENISVSDSVVSFKIPDTAIDGYVTVTVNNISSNNNINNNTVEYNKEDTDDSRWRDDRYVRVFKSNSNDIFPDSAYPKYPSMGMGNTGKLFASYSISSMSQVWASELNGSSQKNLFTAGDQQEETDMMVAGQDNLNILYQANHHYGGQQNRWSARRSGSGSINLYNSNAPECTDYAKGKYWRFECFYHNQMLQQHKNARSATNGDGTSGIIHTIWYDSINSAIKYSNVAINDDTKAYTLEDKYNADSGTSVMQEIAWVVLDGGADLDDMVQTNQTTTDGYDGGANDYPNNAFNHKYKDGSTSGNAYSVSLGTTKAERTAIMTTGLNTTRGATAKTNNSNYNSVDYIKTSYTNEGTAPCNACGETAAICVTSTGLPVVIYYDAEHNMLKLARTNKTNPKGTGSTTTGAGSWRIQQVALTSGHLGNSADYITARIDSNNYLHIAFENSKGQLVYVRSSNKPIDGSKYTFGTSVIVDDCAMWADLTVDSNNKPYISYMSKANSYDSIKLACCDAIDWSEPNNWETMFAPMTAKAGNIRTCIEARPTSKTGGQLASETTSYWKAAVGFCTGSDYRVIKYIGSGKLNY